MGEEESTFETIDRPVESRYFSKDFVEAAPVDEGVDALMMWLDNNLHTAIREEVESSRQFLPPQETIPQPVLESLDYLYAKEAKIYSQLLTRYADNLHQLALINDAERINREKEARKKMPEFYKDRPPKTVQRIKDQQLPILQMMNAFQLQPEKAIIDDLFEQAQSIPIENIVGGELA